MLKCRFDRDPEYLVLPVLGYQVLPRTASKAGLILAVPYAALDGLMF